LSSPHHIKLPPAHYLDDTTHFTPAAELDVEIPNDDMGQIDDFIDDGIVIVPDIIKKNKSWGVACNANSNPHFVLPLRSQQTYL
jgi:hypothetical protein